MNDINKIFLIGRLTKDLEVRYTISGMAIGKTSLAVNRSIKRNNDYETLVSFFEFEVFGKMAENLKQYLTKGKKIAICGSLEQDRWTDAQNQSHSNTYIIADDVQFLDGGKKKGQAGNSQGNGNAPNFNANYQEEYNDDQSFPEDIPF